MPNGGLMDWLWWVGLCRESGLYTMWVFGWVWVGWVTSDPFPLWNGSWRPDSTCFNRSKMVWTNGSNQFIDAYFHVILFAFSLPSVIILMTWTPFIYDIFVLFCFFFFSILFKTENKKCMWSISSGRMYCLLAFFLPSLNDSLSVYVSFQKALYQMTLI